ncbi:MAG: hypothetical protein SGILL_003468 [Bacillariaceae sp.]
MSGSPSPLPSKNSSRRRSREPKSDSKKTPQQSSWRTTEKENSNAESVLSSAWRISPSKKNGSRRKSISGKKSDDRSPHKSHGISPTRFHKKSPSRNRNNVITQSQDEIPDWKLSAEQSLLIQQHNQHLQQLETRRKTFRKQTQLKIWPLQDMAMEHVDYLLGKSSSSGSGDTSGRKFSQFHGGDYLSSESSSSISSVETSRPRILAGSEQSEKVTSSLESPRCANENDSDCLNDTDIPKQQSQHYPLWSLEPRIFAIEKAQGKRKYLVGQFGRIADWYWRKAAAPRHLYEVIREETPCRLYFDLEFSKVYNNNDRNGSDDENDGVPLDTAELLREFREELAIDLRKYYGLTLETSQILNLDSSSDTKFSRHWIVHLTESQDKEQKDDEEETDSLITNNDTNDSEVLFRDAPTVGRFVKRLVSRLAEEIAVEGGNFPERRPMLAKYLFVNTKCASKPTCFIDLGVYTRNRLFRCLGSRKFGKPTTLHATTKEEGQNQPQYYPLLLPRSKKADSSQSSQPMSMDEFVAANDWGPHAKALADTLVVPLRDWPRKDVNKDSGDSTTDTARILDVGDELYGSMTACSLLATAKGSATGTNVAKPRKVVPTVSMAREGSRLPTLDKFVDGVLAARGGILGSIRAWSVEYGPRDKPVSITYHMQRNRYCEMIGRSHKSNNIFWTVDLATWTCFQGCHDPDCYGRGSPVPIPNDDGRMDAIQKEFEDWQEEEFESALASLNLDDIIAKAKKSSCAEEEFENALAALDLDGIIAKAKASSPSARRENNKANDVQEKDDDDDPDGHISDETLMQAVLDNPGLFP